MHRFVAILAFVTATLPIACADPSNQTPPAPVTGALAPADHAPGFTEHEPDTCKASGVRHLIGQPSGNLRTVLLPGPVRIVLPGQVIDQEEYRSNRINAYVDGSGTITGLTCG